MRAVEITEFGGPEVITIREDMPDPDWQEGQLLVEVSSAGVNFADTHQTEDSYLSKTSLPFIPWSEVVGRVVRGGAPADCSTTSGASPETEDSYLSRTTPPLVPGSEEVGRPVRDGVRVLALAPGGGYAEKALVHAAASFELPDDVSDGQALALLVQGLTAWHLLRTSTHLAEGESVVVHAAAGGVGTLAVQLAKAWGAGRVIGVASSPEKRELAESLGADVTVDAGAPDLTAALREANGGRKVDVVLEMVGGPTFDASLAALAPLGRLATFGMAGRAPAQPVHSGALMAGSKAVVGFWLAHCFARRELLAPPMTELLDMVVAGTLTPVVGGTYPLAQAKAAHEALLSRASTGKLILDCAAQ